MVPLSGNCRSRAWDSARFTPVYPLVAISYFGLPILQFEYVYTPDKGARKVDYLVRKNRVVDLPIRRLP
jgi:hypothetical protein